MRRLIAVGAAVVCSIAAASPVASAAPRGTITGVVVNQSTGRPQSGVELTLTTGTQDGTGEVLATAVSDDRGRYRFARLATGDDRFYALDARFEGGLFAGRPVTLPSDTAESPVIESTMRVWNSTTDPSVMSIERDDMFAVANEGGLGVIQSVTMVNSSSAAYIGRGAAMGETSSGVSVAFALPDGATEINVIDSELDTPEIVRTDQGFGATVAIPPGENRITFSYRLPGSGGTFDLSRPMLYDTAELSVFAAPPLEVRSNRLEPSDGVTLEGTRYERWTSPLPIAAGDPLQAIAVANATVPVFPLLAALAALVLAGATVAVVLRRRARMTPPPVAGDDREDLLEQVARLDLAHEQGHIDAARWGRQRRSLITRIERQGGERA